MVIQESMRLYTPVPRYYYYNCRWKETLCLPVCACMYVCVCVHVHVHVCVHVCGMISIGYKREHYAYVIVVILFVLQDSALLF